VPVAKFFYVIDTLRCGKMSCRKDDPRVWDMMRVGTTDELSPTLDPLIPIFMTRLEPALRACYESQRSQLSEPTYETDLTLRVEEQVAVTAGVGAGLPEALAGCATRVIEDAHIRLPQRRADTWYEVPLVFGP
jgi:hypothetical protein